VAWLSHRFRIRSKMTAWRVASSCSSFMVLTLEDHVLNADPDNPFMSCPTTFFTRLRMCLRSLTSSRHRATTRQSDPSSHFARTRCRITSCRFVSASASLQALTTNRQDV